MNRQYKRAMQKQEAARKQPRPPTRPQAQAKRERTKPRDFVREVVAELRKVAWPTRQEVFAYSLVVLVSVIVIAAIIVALDFGFTKAILKLYGVDV